MNTITNDIITYFNFFDFFILSVDFEFKEFENEIYTFIDKHHITFPKKEFLNKDDLLQFYDTFSLDMHRNGDMRVLNISDNVLSLRLPLPYINLKAISVDLDNCVFTSIDGVLYSKDPDQLICNPPMHSASKYELFSSITSICDSAFSGCYNLESIMVESNNQQFCSMDGILFSKNLDTILCFPAKHKFSSYCIPTSVTSIGNSAFYCCKNLQSITIPTSVTSIGDSAFYNCYKLQSITIPTSVTSIGDSAFSDCSKLQSITVESTNLYFASIEGILFTTDFASIICFPSTHQCMRYNILTSVASIDDSAFSNCYKLQIITLPTSVISIGDFAFSDCSILQSITIPTSVTSIGDSAFAHCCNLRSISIPHIYRLLISKIPPGIPLSEIVILQTFIIDRDTT